MKPKLFLFLLFMVSQISAQDIRGGEINYRHISGRTYEVVVSLFADGDSTAGSRSISLISPEDTTVLSTQSQTAMGEITRWNFSTTLTFATSGVQTLLAVDSFWVPGISNIPSSGAEVFRLGAEILVSPISGGNTSPGLTNPPIAHGQVGSLLQYSPGAFDPDGDSLAFRLVNSWNSNYSFPPGAVMDAGTGMLSMPYTAGLFAINIEISEYRSGSLIGRIYREMLIDNSSGIGVAEIPRQWRIEIFPNPVTDVLRINSTQLLELVLLYSAEGERLVEIHRPSQQSLEIPMQGLAPGVYFLEVLDRNGKRHTEKMIHHF